MWAVISLPFAFVADDTALVKAMPHISADSIVPSSSENILLVEDTQAIREDVQALLEGAGFMVTAFADGRRALDWAELHQPGLAVLDLDLPHLDGVAVASLLRARYGALFPVLIFSADDRAYAKTRHLGPCGLIRKPFDADGLVAAVRNGLEGGHHFEARTALPFNGATQPRRHAGGMVTPNGDLATLAAELQRQLDADVLDGFGPVTLLAGTFPDAGLAGRALLADVDHLSSLAAHTGEAPSPERWALLADELYVLLLLVGRRRDRAINGRMPTST